MSGHPDVPRGRPLGRSAPSTVPNEASVTQTTDVDAAWRKAAYAAIKRLAASAETFTSDDVLAAVGAPRCGRQLSVALAVSRRRHVITAVGATLGRRNAPLRLWVGVKP